MKDFELYQQILGLTEPWRVEEVSRKVAAGTVEEKVLGLQAAKRELLAEVFEASDAAAARLSLADLRSLL